MFVAHVALTLLGAVQIIPFTTVLTARCYRVFCQVAALTHAYKMVQRYGLPPFRPWSWANLTSWAQRALPSADFHYAMMALVFLPHPPRALLVVPSGTLALYHVMAFCRSHFSNTSLWKKYGARANDWLAARQSQALVVMAGAEVALGLLLVVELLSPRRQLLLVFFMWNMLKMRYHAPDSAAYHRQVWALLDEKTLPLRARVPAIQTLLGYIQRWFLTIR